MSVLEVKERAYQSLAWIAQYHNKPVDANAISHEYPLESADSHAIRVVAKKLGLDTQTQKIDFNATNSLPCPALVQDKAGNWYILLSADSAHVEILGDDRKPLSIDIHTFKNLAAGTVITFLRMDEHLAEKETFGGAWFVQAFLRFRHSISQILLTALVLQICILVIPLFIQTVIDKVVVHQSMSTLVMLTLGVGLVLCMETILELVKRYLLAHTTSRIDAELGAKLFDKLMDLPYRFFSERSVGQITARMNEVERIRIFLNGATFTALIDLMLSAFLLVVMFLYSPTLAGIVGLSIPLYLAVCFLILPKLFKLYGKQFETSAQSNGFLVETVAGVETLRAMAVEPQMRYQWQGILAAYVRSRFDVTWWVNIGVESVNLISKLITLFVLFFGAKAVMQSDLSIGQLVAFNMLAAAFSAPMIRLSQLWQELQQMRVSVRRLGDILNHPSDTLQTQKHWLADVEGRLDISKLSFQYKPGHPYSLNNINLSVKPGEIIGLVGRSGSGKSTLAKLIQGLYEPNSGTISIDSNPLNSINAHSLRKHLGVVLQENVLFSDTIYKNISFANPHLTFEQIKYAANLAGAHDFISQMPEGYQTRLEERGSNLSGGQRQRIAIARAIVNGPKILILDEATSALDYESEKKLQHNLKSICANKTVIIVAHRLSTVRHADRIVVMDAGEIKEEGTHEQLIEKQGLYADLYQQSQ